MSGLPTFIRQANGFRKRDSKMSYPKEVAEKAYQLH
jgi:hypothetical protein